MTTQAPTPAELREWANGTIKSLLAKYRLVLIDPRHLHALADKLEEFAAWKAGKKGIEDYYILQEELYKTQDKLERMEEALESAVEWMAEDGCDCGTDEPGTCALCLSREALKP